MAGLLCHVNSGEVALVATVAKSVLQIKAPANQRVLIRTIKLMGKQPAGGVDVPVKIRITRSTANFGTFTAATAAKNCPADTETIQTTAGANASAEPTSPTDGGLWWELQPQSAIEEFLPDSRAIVIPGGQSAQFEATSTGTPTVMFDVSFEE